MPFLDSVGATRSQSIIRVVVVIVVVSFEVATFVCQFHRLILRQICKIKEEN